ncbi:MAG TPA: glycoside hydrolase family 3 C-terminal domain-containing protein [Alphaproteobacteria bacterium]|nr:glycoside hydrolase family 3 C-terminal domain-containing protein [Alphaproteobacteria bacterium]
MADRLMLTGLVLLGLLSPFSARGDAPPPYKDPKAPLETRVNDLLGRLTLEEKVSLMSGGGFFSSQPIPRLGVPALRFTDGPNGVRSNEGEAATVFPTGSAAAATWNPDLIAKEGKAIGEEALALGDNVLLGPTVNIQRSPLGGRNFESFSEDPLLAGRLAVGFVEGVQSTGIGTSVKHFAANNQEFNRMEGSSDVDERTLREIYFPAFERAVKEAKPWTVMASYNKINGTFASENKWLLHDVLEQGWGYDGMVISDWGAVHSTVPAAAAGLDLEMPGPGAFYPGHLLEAVKKGEIGEAAIDDDVRRVLRLIFRTGVLDGKPLPKGEVDTPSHRAAARAVAEEAITLLKNDHNLLPLDAGTLKSVAIIGPDADKAVAQGGGSAHVIPAFEQTPLEALKAALGDNVKVSYAQGVDNDPAPPAIDARLLSPTAARDKKGLAFEYFANADLSGNPVQTGIDTYFLKMGFGGDFAASGGDRFSARWKGFFWPPVDGDYEFSTMAFADTTLTLDGKMLISKDTEMVPSGVLDFFHLGQRVAKVELKAGRSYPIELEFRANGNPARLLRLGVRRPTGTIDAAVAAAKAADVAIVVVGSTEETESEGHDRADMSLPGEQDALVEHVLAANKNTIVVLNNGSPMAMPWIAKAPAVVEMWLPGEQGSAALADVLLGKTNPSGKLPVSFPRRLEDNPAYLFYPGGRDEDYGEGVFVGYRYYIKKKIEPLFPFGHGLSYTRFDYADLRAPEKVKAGGTVDVSFTLKNSGGRDGKEVVQLYVGAEEPPVARPVRELKAFQKVALKPGETKEIKLSLSPRDFSYYDVHSHGWVEEPGAYDLFVGASSEDIRLRKVIQVEATSPGAGSTN